MQILKVFGEKTLRFGKHLKLNNFNLLGKFRIIKCINYKSKNKNTNLEII